MNKRHAVWVVAFGLAVLVGAMFASSSQAWVPVPPPHIWKLSARQSCIAPYVCAQCCENSIGGACFQDQCLAASQIGTACTPILLD